MKPKFVKEKINEFAAQSKEDLANQLLNKIEKENELEFSYWGDPEVAGNIAVIIGDEAVIIIDLRDGSFYEESYRTSKIAPYAQASPDGKWIVVASESWLSFFDTETGDQH